MKKLLVSLLFTFLLPVPIGVAAEQENNLHEPWNVTLGTYVHNGSIRYGDMKKNVPDMKKLDAYLDMLAKADINNFSREALLAFWINSYNAFTFKLILNNHPLKSIRDIKNPWKKKAWIAAGERLSLDKIEHEKLRKNIGEPRIHFAIVCASKGCPDISNKAFTAANINNDLDKAARSFFASSKNLLVKKSGSVTTVYLSRIFKWFGNDFGANDKERIDFITPFLSSESASRIKAAEKLKIKFLDYDWSLNGQ